MATKSPPKSEPEYISYATAGAVADCHRRTIARLVADGTLTGYQLTPRAFRVKRSELIAYLESTATSKWGASR